MSVLIQISDFSTGREKIAYNTYTEASVQSYIDKLEKKYIYKVFGVVLGDLVLANPENYPDYLEEFAINLDGCDLISDGFVEAMKGIIFFHYVRDQFAQQTTTGVVNSLSENATEVSAQSIDLYTRYNNGIDTLKAIQTRAIYNDLANFNGQELKYVINI